jgi:hypothetical protein
MRLGFESAAELERWLVLQPPPVQQPGGVLGIPFQCPEGYCAKLQIKNGKPFLTFEKFE